MNFFQGISFRLNNWLLHKVLNQSYFNEFRNFVIHFLYPNNNNNDDITPNGGPLGDARARGRHPGAGQPGALVKGLEGGGGCVIF